MDQQTKDVAVTVALAGAIGAVAWTILGGRRSEPPVQQVEFPDLLPQGTSALLIGDSLGVGLAEPLGQLVIEGGSNLTSIPIGGTAIYQWAKDAKLKQIVDSRPGLVLVSLGTNDGAETLEQLKTERPMLEKLASTILATGAKMVWILPAGRSDLTQKTAPNIDQAIEMIRSSPAMVAAEVPMFESYNLDIPLSRWDGIHSSGEGYSRWAAALYQFLRGNF